LSHFAGAAGDLEPKFEPEMVIPEPFEKVPETELIVGAALAEPTMAKITSIIAKIVFIARLIPLSMVCSGISITLARNMPYLNPKNFFLSFSKT
jgi:hypothetical protein